MSENNAPEATNRKAFRPARDERLLPYVQNSSMFRLFYVMLDVPHASHDPEETKRPMPRVTLHDLKRQMARSTPTGYGRVPEALHFGFYSNRYNVPPEKAIRVPPSHLWWLAASGDTVLLSDGIGHHYTTIAAEDRSGDRISFDDLWPSEFMLLPGRNALGVEARLNEGLSISKSEFERVIVGLITWDTPRLLAHYRAAFPDFETDYDLHLRFALAFLESGADFLAPLAASIMVEAKGLPADPKTAALGQRVAYLAAMLGMAYGARTQNRNAHLAAEQVIRDIEAEHGPLSAAVRDELEADLSPKELARMGAAIQNARDFPKAKRVLDLALAKDPGCEEAYACRAALQLNCNDPVRAATDAEQAIALNEAELVRLAAALAAMHERAQVERGWNEREADDCRLRQEQEWNILIDARLAIPDLAGAREAAHSLLRLRPDRSIGHVRMADVERAAGRLSDAAAALRNAIDP